ncbi:TATDN3 [Cervus elaphus hippelaphus]|uniref:TATDN3 n=1 Tax=Cervus elaphus hippelaphus TaxID=46360 RepID=A0A212CRX1_CEREH|nr:TATDN3 [Cervus elaphus hippelaphus]
MGAVGVGMVDCHCHLSAPDFDHDLDDVLEKAKKDLDVALPIIENYKDQLLAIGEVGLDFSPRFAVTDEQKEEQRQVLIRQVQLAKRLNLPLNVHSRSAGRPTISLLNEQVSKDCFRQVSRLTQCLFVLFQVRNEPRNISISAEYIAQVKGVSVEEVIDVTTQNALKLFPKLQRLLPK